MKKIPFKDLPSTDTPIDSANLNLLQDNVEDAIDEVANNVGDLNDLETTNKASAVGAINELNDDIKIVEYTPTYSVTSGQGTSGRFTINTSVPSGYKWVGYLIVANGFANTIITWIISSSSTSCVVAWYNTSTTTPSNLKLVLKGIYKKV